MTALTAMTYSTTAARTFVHGAVIELLGPEANGLRISRWTDEANDVWCYVEHDDEGFCCDAVSLEDARRLGLPT